MSSVLHEKYTHIKYRLRCDISEMTEGVCCAEYTKWCWWRGGRAQRKFIMLQLKSNLLVCKRDFSILFEEIWRISFTAIQLKKVKIVMKLFGREFGKKSKEFVLQSKRECEINLKISLLGPTQYLAPSLFSIHKFATAGGKIRY